MDAWPHLSNLLKMLREVRRIVHCPDMQTTPVTEMPRISHVVRSVEVRPGPSHRM